MNNGSVFIKPLLILLNFFLSLKPNEKIEYNIDDFLLRFTRKRSICYCENCCWVRIFDDDSVVNNKTFWSNFVMKSLHHDYYLLRTAVIYPATKNKFILFYEFYTDVTFRALHSNQISNKFASVINWFTSGKTTLSSPII